MKLKITNLQRKTTVQKKKIKKKTKQILLLQNRKDANLSIVFVNDKIIKKLNQKFLHKNKPTDVLAFDLKTKKESKKTIDGEIIISVETAARNAKIYKTSLNNEALLYLIHGVLHLCGYDDTTNKEKMSMRQREQYILGKIK